VVCVAIDESFGANFVVRRQSAAATALSKKETGGIESVTANALVLEKPEIENRDVIFDTLV